MNGEMIQNPFGRIVEEEWLSSEKIRKEIELDVYIVMPNHIHGIIWIQTERARGRRPETREPWERKPRSLGSFVAGFKSAVTKRVNRLRDSQGQPVWQRNYHDHIIRDEESLRKIRQYILDNPARWAEDPENPAVNAPST